MTKSSRAVSSNPKPPRPSPTSRSADSPPNPGRLPRGHRLFHSRRREFQPAARGVEIHAYGLPVMHLAFKYQPAEWRLDLFLDGTLQRARSIRRIVTRTHQV